MIIRKPGFAWAYIKNYNCGVVEQIWSLDERGMGYQIRYSRTQVWKTFNSETPRSWMFVQ